MKAKLLARLRRLNAGTPREDPARRSGETPLLFPENVLAWRVLVDAFTRRQFIVGPMGGVVGFRYESLLAMMDIRVPPERRLEVYEKVGWIEQYAINAVTQKRADGEK